MDLTGSFTMKLGWQKPQIIKVRQVGNSYLFSFEDQLERTVNVEGRLIGYDVTEFKSRDFFHLTTFVVFGDWEQVTYRDWRGRMLPVEISHREYHV